MSYNLVWVSAQRRTLNTSGHQYHYVWNLYTSKLSFAFRKHVIWIYTYCLRQRALTPDFAQYFVTNFYKTIGRILIKLYVVSFK